MTCEVARSRIRGAFRHPRDLAWVVEFSLYWSVRLTVLPNVVLDPESLTVVGILDTARAGLADGYTDVALMHRSLASPSRNPQYGDQRANRFLARRA